MTTAPAGCAGEPSLNCVCAQANGNETLIASKLFCQSDTIEAPEDAT